MGSSVVRFNGVCVVSVSPQACARRDAAVSAVSGLSGRQQCGVRYYTSLLTLWTPQRDSNLCVLCVTQPQ